jgi:lysophospholipase L1-like esterase
VTVTSAPALGLTCPSAQSGISLQNQPVSISWPDPTPQGGTAPVQTSCAPASGSAFTEGVTPVSCTASDAAGEHAACAFTVTITRPLQLSATRFMAYGDSITWGRDSPPGTFFVFPEPPPWFAYPSQLRMSLEMRYGDQTPSMANEGWPGEAVGDGLTRLPGALTANNPEVLLLLDGANDLLGNPSSPTTVYIASQLREMVRAAKRQSPTIKVLLATFPPQTRGTFPYDRGAGRAFVPELNQRIAAVAQSEGVTLVDLYAAFPSNLKPYIGQDGLHPTPKGFTLIARAFAKVIQQTLEVQTTGAGASLR